MTCIKISLKRDLELVALRFTPKYDLGGIAKQALYAYVDGEQSFRIRFMPNVEYAYRPLLFKLQLSDGVERDSQVIKLLDGLSLPVPTFVKNVIMRYVEGSVDSVYSDRRLAELVFQHERGAVPMAEGMPAERGEMT